MKLTDKQREALEWLSEEPWVATWWGGLPHGSWPKKLRAQTYNSLSLKKLISTKKGTSNWADRVVEITEAGRAAIKDAE